MKKDCVYSEDGITYMSDKQYNNYIDIIEQLQQENKELKEVIDKAIEYINSQSPDAGVSGKHIKDILKEVE